MYPLKLIGDKGYVTNKEFKVQIKSSKIFKNYSILVTLFILFLTLSFLFTPVKSVGLLGDSGRSLGYLNYLSFIIICHLDKLRNGFIDLLRLKNGHFLDEMRFGEMLPQNLSLKYVHKM